MLWMTLTDSRSSRLFLAVYCVVTTFFCLHFLRLAKQYSVTYSQPCPPTAKGELINSDFPRKIWQTSKASAAGLEDQDRKAIQSWLKINQKHRYEIITQYSGEGYVRDKFSHRPDVIEVFTDLQDPILRADFIRYLVLLGDGGVYSDLDVCPNILANLLLPQKV